MTGLVHSIETMGLLDGPGIRCVVFMQGCKLRCKYCHNPDTWELSPKPGAAKEYTPQEIVRLLLRYKEYFGSDGGVTFSGGEPLLQKEFLKETLKLCKEAGIHTCIDTSGCGDGDYEEILEYADLVLLDVKQIEAGAYKELTGQDISGTKEFLCACIAHNKPLWISHVMVPGFTDNDQFVEKLKEYVLKIPNVLNIRILPYHKLGSNKYKEQKINDPLSGVKAMDRDRAKEYERYLNEQYNKEKNYAN